MKIFSFFLAFSIFVNSNVFSQVQFSEDASLLGCVNSSYGIGSLGGGISFFDFDNDGWDDITVSSEEGSPVKFFKNNNGVFTEVTINIPDELFETKTVQWVDFDNDGDYDFFVTSNIDSNRLYENDGSMNFTEITITSGLYIEDNITFGGSWGDYNNDGWLDLFISSRDYESVVEYSVLYKNNGNGTFTDVTDISNLSLVNQTSFCSAFFDYNNDGWQDIYIANDRDPKNLLYKNNGDGTFTEVGGLSNTGVSIDAMSTTIGDYNQDGWLDIYVTNTFDGNVFFENNADGTFTDIAASNGTLFESVAWGSVFLDAENDADLDLYVSGMLDGSGGTLPSAFYENDGTGNYTIPNNAGFDQDIAKSFSNAIGDIDNNGYPDITVLNYEPNNIFLWNNTSPETNNWLKVKLQGVESNRQGIGSWIEISVNGEKQFNYTLLGEGYLAQNSAYEFFGIGTASSIDYIKVTWLSGTVDFFTNPSVNTQITILEGSGELSINDYTTTLKDVVLYSESENTFIVELTDSMLNCNLIIFDINGRKLKSLYNLSSKDKINMRLFEAGIYVFTFEKSGILITKRVIIK